MLAKAGRLPNLHVPLSKADPQPHPFFPPVILTKARGKLPGRSRKICHPLRLRGTSAQLIPCLRFRTRLEAPIFEQKYLLTNSTNRVYNYTCIVGTYSNSPHRQPANISIHWLIPASRLFTQPSTPVPTSSLFLQTSVKHVGGEGHSRFCNFRTVYLL
jgi:hypothetical protein